MSGREFGIREAALLLRAGAIGRKELEILRLEGHLTKAEIERIKKMAKEA